MKPRASGVRRVLFAAVLHALACTGTSPLAFAQAPTRPPFEPNSTKATIVQSPFYDTQALYYASFGYEVYVIPKPKTAALVGAFPADLPAQTPIGGEAPPQGGTPFAPAADPAPAGGPGGNPGAGRGRAPGRGAVPAARRGADTRVTAPVFAPVADPAPGVAPGFAPGPGGRLQTYSIVESLTGKMLKDTVLAEGQIDRALLSPYHNPENAQRVIQSILSRNAGADDELPLDTLGTLYAANPFLAGLAGPRIALRDTSTFVAANVFLETEASFAGGAGLTTRLADGYAQFLIERINEEANVAFFEQMQRTMNRHEELQLLFPESYEFLGKIKAYNFQIALNALKASFETDTKSILTNVSKLTQMPRYQALLRQHPQLTLAFVACDVSGMALQGKHPADLIHNLYTKNYIKTTANEYTSAVRLTGLFSYCFRDIQLGEEIKEEKKWINASLMKYLRNPGAVDIFLGLMYQNAPEIRFGSERSFRELLAGSRANLANVHNLLNNFLTTATNIERHLANANIDPAPVAEGNSATLLLRAKAYQNIAREVMGLADNGLALFPHQATAGSRAAIGRIQGQYLPLLQRTTSVIEYIQTKDYSGAVYESYILLDNLFLQLDSVYNTSCAGAATAPPAVCNTLAAFRQVKPLVLKYGLFISSVAVADDAQDVKEAIKAFALPAGSSRVKKESQVNIALNSYVSYYAGDYVRRPSSLQKLPRNVQGITAPLGVSLSYGFNEFGSVSLYGSILDVGAILTYRLNDDSTQAIPDVDFSNILSPGFSLVYGFPIIRGVNIPLSAGITYQWGPLLSRVAQSGNTFEVERLARYHFFIGFDIPIVNFFSNTNGRRRIVHR